MLPQFVRPANAGDSEKFLEWQKSNPNFDPEAALMPDSFTLVAFDKEKTHAYMPVQFPYIVEPAMLESIATNPESTPLQIATAMKELIQFCVSMGYLKNYSQIFFLGDNPVTNKLAEHHLFEKLDWPIYRLRLSDLSKS